MKSSVEERLNKPVSLNIKHIQDFRNYKVSTAKASNVLSFHSRGDIRSIVNTLVDNQDKFQDWDNPEYSNIQSFKKLGSAMEAPSLAGVNTR